MTYEQWTAAQSSIAVGALVSFVLAGFLTYFMSRRPADQNGKRKGRPGMSLLAGVLTFFVVGLAGAGALATAYPDYYARYEREYGIANQQAERQGGGSRRESLAACMNACPDAPIRCGTLDADRCEQRQRESFSCVQRCDDQYGPH